MVSSDSVSKKKVFETKRNKTAPNVAIFESEKQKETIPTAPNVAIYGWIIDAAGPYLVVFRGYAQMQNFFLLFVVDVLGEF